MKNREIKFRMWDSRCKKMVFTDFHLLGEVMSFNLIDQWIIENKEGCGLLERYKDMIFQRYTGLSDRNGKRVYEGDILRKDYQAIYEINDENNKFIKWSKDQKDFYKLYEVIDYIGDYEINASEYTVGINGFILKVIKNIQKSSYDEVGEIHTLCGDIIKENYMSFGINPKNLEVVGNIYENSDLL